MGNRELGVWGTENRGYGEQIIGGMGNRESGVWRTDNWGYGEQRLGTDSVHRLKNIIDLRGVLASYVST